MGGHGCDAADTVKRFLPLAEPRFERPAGTVNLSQVIQHLVPLLKLCAADKTEIRYSLRADLPEILAKAEPIRRLVTTLFFSACEAVGDKPGVILIRTQAVFANRQFNATLDCEPILSERWHVWLQIIDTGADTADLLEWSGRGWSGSEAAAIVRRQEGGMWVTRSPGKGKIVHVLLPSVAET
ncbi:MAG TPA: hypothetical protein VE988_25765 [Gemmataceae bacterium]|nr:hypothetical protein [Gemmataceae bacterium]